MSLRIVAGEFGGRRIDVPPGRQVRPTGERVREAWFSALGDRIRGAMVIDLFSGSGALGIEALSRGAATVHFVEQDRRCFEVLRHNIDVLDISVRTRLHRGEVFTFLSITIRIVLINLYISIDYGYIQISVVDISQFRGNCTHLIITT